MHANIWQWKHTVQHNVQCLCNITPHYLETIYVCVNGRLTRISSCFRWVIGIFSTLNKTEEILRPLRRRLKDLLLVSFPPCANAVFRRIEVGHDARKRALRFATELFFFFSRDIFYRRHQNHSNLCSYGFLSLHFFACFVPFRYRRGDSSGARQDTSRKSLSAFCRFISWKNKIWFKRFRFCFSIC